MSQALARALARRIDISCVRSRDSAREIDAMAAAARRFPFICAFALPAFTARLAGSLRGTETALGGTVGFPSGCDTTAAKVFQTRELLAMGCRELDMVANIGLLRGGDFDGARADIAAVARAAGKVPLKVILEVTLLTDEEITRACAVAVDGGAAFVKTGTGWMPAPTEVRHIARMRRAVGGRAQVKAAGGVRDLATVREMRAAGCDRFGISLCHTVRLLEEAEKLPDSYPVDWL